MTTILDEHSFGARDDINPTGECLICGDGRRGVPCCHRVYSRLHRRFVQAHLEAYTSAYENPDARAASHELERLDEERRNLPRGHICSEPGGCPSENKARSIPACPVCRARWKAQISQVCADCDRLPRQFRPKDCLQCAALSGQAFGVEIGRTSPVNAPAPMTLLLDYFGGNM